MRLWVKLMPRLMEIDLLATESQCFPALTEGHHLKAKCPGIKDARGLHIGNGQHEMVDTVNHPRSLSKLTFDLTHSPKDS